MLALKPSATPVPAARARPFKILLAIVASAAFLSIEAAPPGCNVYVREYQI
jgi:hypothetical protein